MIKLSHKYVLFIIGSLLFLNSCISNQNLTYLKVNDTKDFTTVSNYQPYQLQKGDLLFVQIKSETGAFPSYFETYNNEQLSNNNSSMDNSSSPYLNSYIVNDKGAVTLPIIGEVMVIGLNLESVTQQIKEKVNDYFKKEVFVDVKIVNFEVTVLGEVNRPGRYFANSNKISLLGALGQAGDLTIFANPEAVQLIRQDSAGNQIHIIDLTDSNIIHSSYFQLQPHDVIYVPPFEKGAQKQLNNSAVALVVSAVTALGILVSLFVQ
ncbi:MAG: polysaccharide biosynthesis/export family protein [Bacteroidota bacterium]